ncbi:MAG: DegT/DnrJ/EryC1/StrS family aminotransferase [Lentisphaerae bacterium]|nr:DegT/DnrJ/EryC1/StrS family aminotransferase [Lentisphaerota bacterium]
MNKLAIDGGTPAFQPDELAKLVPAWPLVYPETDQKLLEVYHSGKWGLCGKYEQLLMEEFAAFQDAKYSVWMCNGTTTLECALLALGVGPGDEVIVPGVTWIATAEAAIYVGAKPVIVDIDPETLCLDPAKFEEAITPRTKAVIPVHLYSALADMDKINAIAKKHGIHVVEDCAHAHGAKQHGKGAGSLSEYGSFSFQLSKLMTGGEGGCLITNDEHLADLAFRLSHIGNSRLHPKDPLQTGLECHQYRFTEFQAAIIYDQLHHQAEVRARHQAAVKIICDILKDIPLVQLQKSSYEDDLRDYYFFTFLLRKDYLKEGLDRSWIFNALRAEGTPLGSGWGSPLYKSPAWNIPENQFIKKDTSVCEDVMYNRLMATLHNLLLAEPAVLTRWAEAVRKVLLAAMK